MWLVLGVSAVLVLVLALGIGIGVQLRSDDKGRLSGLREPSHPPTEDAPTQELRKPVVAGPTFGPPSPPAPPREPTPAPPETVVTADSPLPLSVPAGLSDDLLDEDAETEELFEEDPTEVLPAYRDPPPPLPQERGPIAGGRLPVLAVPGVVLFPGPACPLQIGSDRARRAVAAAAPELVFVALHDSDGPHEPDNIRAMGVRARVLKTRVLDDGRLGAVVQGLERVRLSDWVIDPSHLWVRVEPIEVPALAGGALVALRRHALYGVQWRVLPFETGNQAEGASDAGELADLLASALPLDVRTKRKLLETLDPESRARSVTSRILDLVGDPSTPVSPGRSS